MSGKNIALGLVSVMKSRAMSSLPSLDLLISHLERTTPLSARDVERIVLEVLAYLNESPETFVVRRHAELQAEGLRNDVIYARILSELGALRFKAPRYSERQLRRLIYG